MDRGARESPSMQDGDPSFVDGKLYQSTPLTIREQLQTAAADLTAAAHLWDCRERVDKSVSR